MCRWEKCWIFNEGEEGLHLEYEGAQMNSFECEGGERGLDVECESGRAILNVKAKSLMLIRNCKDVASGETNKTLQY